MCDIIDNNRINTVQRIMLHNCYHSGTRRVYTFTHHEVGESLKISKYWILAKSINVQIEHIKHLKAEIAS